MIRVEKHNYRGWPDSYFVSNGLVDLVVLADVGPRIVRYGFVSGENQFHGFDEQAGTSGGDDFCLYGGHRL